MNFASWGITEEVGLRLLWSLTLIGGAYLIGHGINGIVLRRLTRLAGRTGGSWDDIVLDEVRRRVPFWSLLVGAWLSLQHWPLSARTLDQATSGLRALGILSFTVALSAVITRLVAAYGAGGNAGVPVSGLTQHIVRLVIIVLGILVVARDFGFEVTPYLAALGVGGLAVALALQDPLSNLFGGIFMSLSGHMRIGDYVRVDAIEGYVLDFDWRTTRIRTLANTIVTVPNTKLSQSVVINFSRPSTEVGFSVDVVVDYASDLAHVERVVMDVARAVLRDVQGGVRDADVNVRFQNFTAAGVTFGIGLKGLVFTDQYLLRHEFVKSLHARFVAEGIKFGYPMQALTAPAPLPITMVER